jgi:cytoskeleton protein RodZ
MMDTIGQRLRKARESHHLTLEKAAEATRIRTGYLRALEADDYSTLPSPVQARGFLRNYAQYLELDLDQLVDELRAMQQTGPQPDAEVVFETDQQEPRTTSKDTSPESKNEELPVEPAEEPFWQTWLRRMKSESGELGELDLPVPQTEPPLSDGESRDEIPPAPAIPVEDEVALPEPITRPANAREPDSIIETEAGHRAEGEVEAEKPKVEDRTKVWALFLEQIKTRFHRKPVNPAPVVEVDEEPEPDLELEQEPEPQGSSGSEPSPSSQEIINEIGQELRRRREMLSLSLDEIERHTRMRVEFMAALEKGDFDELPSPVQTRGMLANYAGFLDLDVDALMLRFADALQARHRERHPEKPARRRGQPIIPENLPPFRSFIAGDVVFGVGMVLLLVAFSVWGISRVIALQTEHNANLQAEATGPSISEALIGTPVETIPAEVTLIPAADTPIPEVVEAGTVEIPTLSGTANVQLNIIAVERSFLRVTVDGEVVFEGRTIPGNAYPYEADQSIEILAGNGAALHVIYNQRDLGLLGGFGQIASFIYTPNEILIPTPAVSPTATSTPFLSPTPTITSTSTSAPTPTSTPSTTNTPASGSE